MHDDIINKTHSKHTVMDKFTCKANNLYFQSEAKLCSFDHFYQVEKTDKKFHQPVSP